MCAGARRARAQHADLASLRNQGGDFGVDEIEMVQEAGAQASPRAGPQRMAATALAAGSAFGQVWESVVRGGGAAGEARECERR
jgi:hypothetical protein